MPIIIKEKFKNTNKMKDKIGGGGMDIGKTLKKKKLVKKMMGGANKMKPVKASKGKVNNMSAKPGAYGLTKKKIINLVNMLDNKAPKDAAKLRKEFGIK